MSSTLESTAPRRFFRPTDANHVRRNMRRIHLQRLAATLRNTAFAVVLVLCGLWAYRQTQSDGRFAVKHIEITGAVHTPRAEIESLTRRYTGLNLFKIDIAGVQHDLGSLAWVERIAIEKKIPDTLRIKVVERTPVALLHDGPGLRYIDANGVVLDPLSPSVGDADLPVVESAAGPDAVRAVQFLDAVRGRDAELYSRISAVRPVEPYGFAVFDRQLGATVYVNDADAAATWRTLYSIVDAEGLGRDALEYADLRFADRIVVKPVHPIATGVRAPAPSPAVQITN